MPRYIPSQLRWSEQVQDYVLSSEDPINIQTFSSDWLEHSSSFSFHSRWGMHYTVRKQQVQRGSDYWYAYRRLHGRIVKRYLGKTTDLTFARLEEIARLLEDMSSSHSETLAPTQTTALSTTTSSISITKDPGPPAQAGTMPLLLSKLAQPRLHAFYLDRPHLFALLDSGCEGPLTLLSAPAGFGKTTLVCQWLAARRSHHNFPLVAWLSLENADNDPLRFWRYLITACQTFQIELQELQTALQALAPQPPFVPSSLETVLITLLNSLAQYPSQGILVLEDFHLITAPEIQETLTFFLEHLPANIHLLIITRSDPPFSLARLRARNALCEIRTADLRFSSEESSDLLQHSLPFPLEASTIQRLHTYLQGWGAGLHLIKLALQRTTTPAEREQVLELFASNNASVQEYFVSEVLTSQPESVQMFVLQTNFLTHLTGSLCAAVTSQPNSQDMLALLERSNLFLEPLTPTMLHPAHSTQQWYRYHALFAVAMGNEARRRFSEEYLQQLAVRASQWYEQHSLLHEAIDTALVARDYERAARLITRSIDESTFPGKIAEPHTLQQWLAQLPETILKQQPVLCLSYASTLLFHSASWQPTAQTLSLLEQLLSMAEQGFRMENQQVKLGELFAFRSLLALRRGDIQTATRAAEQALDWLTPAQQLWRGLSLSIVGEKWLQQGHFPQAQLALLEAHALCETVGNGFFKRVAQIKLAQVYFEQGKFQLATISFRQALVEVQQDKAMKTLAHWHCVALLGLAALSYECNQLASADQYVQETITVSQSHELLYHEVQAMLIRVRIQQARGQLFVAQQQLSELFDRVVVSLPHLTQEIQTAQARLALTLGDQMTLQRWATARSPHPDYLQATEQTLLFSRWLRIQGKLDEASHQLEHLLATSSQLGHTRRMLEIQVEMVLIAAARKQKSEAQRLLHAILVQAFDGNALRLFLDAGEQLAILLRTLLPQVHDQPLQTYIRTLLNAFPISQSDDMQTQPAALVEPLTPQEMRVLRLLVQHRSNADIASELVVSINTVRTQIQSIYSKLGVHTRNAASDVARELRLIS